MNDPKAPWTGGERAPDCNAPFTPHAEPYTMQDSAWLCGQWARRAAVKRPDGRMPVVTVEMVQAGYELALECARLNQEPPTKIAPERDRLKARLKMLEYEALAALDRA